MSRHEEENILVKLQEKAKEIQSSDQKLSKKKAKLFESLVPDDHHHKSIEDRSGKQQYNEKKSKKVSQKTQEEEKSSSSSAISERNLSISIGVKKLSKFEVPNKLHWKKNRLEAQKFYQLDFAVDFMSKKHHELKKLNKLDVEDWIRKHALELQVYPVELKRWIHQYELITEVEKTIEKKKLARQDIFQELGALIVTLMRTNPELKKASMEIIVENVLKHLKFNYQMAKRWITFLVNENFEKFKLHPIRKVIKKVHDDALYSWKPLLKRRFLGQEIVKTNDMELIEYNFDREEQQERKEEPAKELKRQSKKKKPAKKKEKSKIEVNEPEEKYQFPSEYKHKLAVAVDELMKKKIEEILTKKAQQTCLPQQIVRSIYDEFGIYKIGSPKRNSSHKKILRENVEEAKEQFLSFSVHCNSLTKVEEKLVEYMKKSPDCNIDHLITETKHWIKTLKLEDEPSFENNERISRWIKNTLEHKGIRRTFSTEKKSDSKGSKKNEKQKVI